MLRSSIGNQFLAGLHAVDLLKIREERSIAFCIEASAVHTELVEIAHLLSHRAELMFLGCETLDEFAELVGVVVGKLCEAAPTRESSRLRVVVDPVACSKLEEVVARTSCGVKVGIINSFFICLYLFCLVLFYNCFVWFFFWGS